MKFVLSFLTIWLVMARVAGAAGDPALPGNHPLTQSQAGDVLISEMRCAACHTGIERQSIPEKAAPDLVEAGSRVSPDYLRRFLASPSSAHPGTTMPDLLAGRSETERHKIADALTHFLVAQSKAPFAAERPAKEDTEQGKQLYHSVGCVACHGPKEALAESPPTPASQAEEEDEDPQVKATKVIRPTAVSLEHVASKYSAKSLSEFLFQPLRVRSSGRMPDMKLTPEESQAIASYLVDERSGEQPVLAPQAALVSEGKGVLSATQLLRMSCAPWFYGSAANYFLGKSGSNARLPVAYSGPRSSVSARSGKGRRDCCLAPQRECSGVRTCRSGQNVDGLSLHFLPRS